MTANTETSAWLVFRKGLQSCSLMSRSRVSSVLAYAYNNMTSSIDYHLRVLLFPGQHIRPACVASSPPSDIPESSNWRLCTYHTASVDLRMEPCRHRIYDNGWSWFQPLPERVPRWILLDCSLHPNLARQSCPGDHLFYGKEHDYPCRK
jgi:hypothetical protein